MTGKSNKKLQKLKHALKYRVSKLAQDYLPSIDTSRPE
jgi:hypothetical protein